LTLTALFPPVALPDSFQCLVTRTDSLGDLPTRLDPFGGSNLAMHVGDKPERVIQNRTVLAKELGLSQPILWLNQVHGVVCHEAKSELIANDLLLDGDAWIVRQSGVAAGVLTADCLPVFVWDVLGEVIGVAHAGWRGLCLGVVEEMIKKIDLPPERLVAWLGPCIGPESFEVGQDVYDAFMVQAADSFECFQAKGFGKYWANLPGLAIKRLKKLGLAYCYQSSVCTYRDEKFYSYRRTNQTGRMASIIIKK
jgi:YfiH family protein